MKIVQNLILAAASFGVAFLIALGMHAQGFDWEAFGAPIAGFLGFDMYDDNVYLAFIFACIGLLGLAIFILLRAILFSSKNNEVFSAVFAAISISSFVFILLAWIDGGNSTLMQIVTISFAVFAGLVLLFQFRGMDNAVGRLSAVIELPVALITTLYVVIAGALWFIGSVATVPFLFAGESWTGESARPIYWATNAVAFAGILFVITGLLYVLIGSEIMENLFSVEDLDSLYETLASPIVAISILAMTIHTFLSPVYAERLSSFLG